MEESILLQIWSQFAVFTVSESDRNILKALTALMKLVRKLFLALATYAIIYPVATSANKKNIVEPSCAGGDIGTMSPSLSGWGSDWSLLALCQRQMVQGYFFITLLI